jgi:peptide deformylase
MIPPETAHLRIVLYPDPVLKKRCAPVTEFDGRLEMMARRMLELMHDGKGIGLAAPQVGVPVRMFVCNDTGEPADDRVFINPQFIELTGAAEMEEGCLSIPGALVTMRRATHAEMRAVDLAGNPVEVAGDDLRARVWQHESDHLEGRLIIDNMSPTDEIANRRVLKQLKGDAGAARRM